MMPGQVPEAPLRVLLVEDDRALAQQLGQVLTIMDSAVVHTAVNQHDACEWLAANPAGWDLALIDVFLAAGHGFNVLRQCAGRSSQQRVALMSSYARAPMRERALEAGADAFVDKTEPGALVEFCADMLKRGRTFVSRQSGAD